MDERGQKILSNLTIATICIYDFFLPCCLHFASINIERVDMYSLTTPF